MNQQDPFRMTKWFEVISSGYLKAKDAGLYFIKAPVIDVLAGVITGKPTAAEV